MTESIRLPVLYVQAETCGEAWEKAVETVWLNGINIEQHYKDKMSKEATVIINVTNPLAEPRFSRKDFVSVAMFMMGEEKKKPYREKQYVKDLIDGDMDFRVEQGIESYTYHERICRWGLEHPKHQEMLKQKGLLLKLDNPRKMRLFPPIIHDPPTETVNQMEMLIAKAKEEIISRKLQVTTWEPHKDLLISGAPCLQRIWFRVIDGKYLVMETHWRSRDLYKAWGSNCLAMVELGKWIAEELGLIFVQMVDFSNSLHIYASDYEQVQRHFEIIQHREEKSNVH